MKVLSRLSRGETHKATHLKCLPTMSLWVYFNNQELLLWYFKLGLISLAQLYFKDKAYSSFLTRLVSHLGRKILFLHQVRKRWSGHAVLVQNIHLCGNLRKCLFWSFSEHMLSWSAIGYSSSLQKIAGFCSSVCSNVVVGAVILWRSIFSKLQILLAQIG